MSNPEKSWKKSKAVKFLVDFLAIFVGLMVSDGVEKLLPTGSSWIHFVVSVVCIFVFWQIASFIYDRIAKTDA